MTFFPGVEGVFHKRLRFFICRSFKFFGTHLPILLIFPIARKHLLIVCCGTFNASANCCWVWFGSTSSAACIPRLRTLWSTRAHTLKFKLLKPCLTCPNQWIVFTTSKRWLSTAFFFWLNKKSNACRKCSFQAQTLTWSVDNKTQTLLFNGLNLCMLVD